MLIKMKDRVNSKQIGLAVVVGLWPFSTQPLVSGCVMAAQRILSYTSIVYAAHPASCFPVLHTQRYV